MSLALALVDRLAAEYAGGRFVAEAARARSDYLQASGKVFDDDGELFEARMASFLEWYIVDRPMDGGHLPPAQRALGEMTDLGDEERRGLAHLATSHWSVFECCGVDGHVLDLEDAIGGARFAVVERRSTVGFAPGSVFEARLVHDGQAVVFGKTFLFHPEDAREEICKRVDALAQKNTVKQDIIFHLARAYLRWVRHGHANGARIYAEQG